MSPSKQHKNFSYRRLKKQRVSYADS